MEENENFYVKEHCSGTTLVTGNDGLHGNGVKIKRLTKILKQYHNHYVDAAVAVLIHYLEESLDVLLVKRASSLSDPWSGQMALPGGRRSFKDESLRQTVIRETLEETNINLNSCRFLGVMEPKKSEQIPEISVLPFVYTTQSKPLIILNEELEQYIWIKLRELPERKGVSKQNSNQVPAYFIKGNVIWGLTYRILEDLISILIKNHRES